MRLSMPIRHVAVPPPELPSFSACEAGWALFQQWTNDAEMVEEMGLFASVPLLVIDDDWLAEAEDATPPHVVLSLSKNHAGLNEQPVSGLCMKGEHSPFRELFGELLERVIVNRVEPNLDNPEFGAWIIQLKSANDGSH